VFERGFKSWCENVAVQQRREVGLSASDPLDPYLLAKSLEVKIWKAEEVQGLDARSIDILLRRDPNSWSAVTLHIAAADLIILNSSHSFARQASDLMHELAHILLGHVPARVDVTEDGLLILNTFNKHQEAEAAWLAGCLLLPRDCLILIRRSRMDLPTAARRYGASVNMLQYRINVTGVDHQFRASKPRYTESITSGTFRKT
jgi:Zn-dependent peptidase ImmA (M78 family)